MGQGDAQAAVGPVFIRKEVLPGQIIALWGVSGRLQNCLAARDLVLGISVLERRIDECGVELSLNERCSLYSIVCYARHLQRRDT